jgi:hypothetical protein
LAIGHSHSYSIFGVRVKTLDSSKTVGIVNFLEYLLPLHLHTHSVLQLVLQMLVGQMDEVEIDLAMRWQKTERSVLERAIGIIDDLLWKVLNIAYQSRLFFQVWFSFL